MQDTRAHAIHEAVMTIDSHDDIPFNFATEAVDPLDAARQLNLEKMRAGGLDAAFFIVYVGQTERTPENYARAQADAMTKFDAIHRMAGEMYPDLIELAYTPDDVERIHSEGKLVAAIGIENGYVIGRDLSLLQRYHDLGARYVTLAHNGHNDIADSAQPRMDLGDAEAEHDGISEFGAQAIAEMNRLGIMVDLSHVSRAAGTGCDSPVPGAGDRFALQCACSDQSPSQHGRRNASRATRQRRSDAGHRAECFCQGILARTAGGNIRHPERIWNRKHARLVHAHRRAAG